MKNKFNIILACLWLLIALFFSWILISKLSDGNNSLFNGHLLFNSKVADRIFGDDGIVINIGDLSDGDITTLYKDYSFDASQIESFTIDLVSASVYLQPSEDSDVTVKLYGNWNSDIEPKVSVERKKLHIKSPTLTIKNKVNLGSRKVFISIPESALSRIVNADISTVSGSIHVSDIFFGELTTESTSGSIHVDCVAEILTANTVSGSIHTSGSYSNSTCETVSGSIHVETDKPLTGRNNFESVSGSVHITIPEESGFEFEWETISGSVNNAFYSGKCKKSGSQIIGDGKALIKVETVSGSIHVNKN